MVTIELSDMRIHSVSNSSGVFWGDNLLFKWKSVKTDNSGYGTLAGSNNLCFGTKCAVIKDEKEEGRL